MRLVLVTLMVSAVTVGATVSACAHADPAPTTSTSPATAPVLTRHPIVLAHGFMGFDQRGPLRYWWGIPEALTAAGGAVTVADDGMARGIEDRAKQLAIHVDQVLALTGASRVNIVAHSMGGLDARALISHLGYGDRVSALLTVGTPHRGTPIADDVGALPSPVRVALSTLLDPVVGWIDGKQASDLSMVTADLSTSGAAAFNARTPDDPRVRYYSAVGRTSMDLTAAGDDFCDANFWLTYAWLRSHGVQSDGLVPVESQKWGEVLETIDADHGNQIGHPLGWTGSRFQAGDRYVQWMRALAERGH